MTSGYHLSTATDTKTAKLHFEVGFKRYTYLKIPRISKFDYFLIPSGEIILML